MTASAFKSFQEQSLNYFIREHSYIPTGPIEAKSAWRGDALRSATGEWLFTLNCEELAELSVGVDALIARGVPLAEVSSASLSLPLLYPRLLSWREAIKSGLGFVVLRGLPVEEWGVQKSSMAYWAIGHYLGFPGAQNPQDELLGHVVDYGEETDNPIVRRYRTTGNIDFHCDAADAVGLLCLATAKRGGQSRIVSSVSVFNEIYKQAPELIPRLFEPIALDLRDEEPEGMPGYFMLPPSCFSEENGLQTFYHSEYFRSAERHADISYDEQTHALLDLYDSLCARADLQLDMWLEPGDMQFISNHTIAHARTDYEDWPEPERKRHLLRLWLSL